MAKDLKVLIVGAAGRMGREAVLAVATAADMELVGAVGRSRAGDSLGAIVPNAASFVNGLSLESDFAAVLARTKPNIVVELSHGDEAIERSILALKSGAHPVIGATGFSEAAVERLRAVCAETGLAAMIVPNFAIGAVLMMHFAEIAARFIPDVQVIELHHEKKKDAPSGTALRTAEMIAAARQAAPAEKPEAVVKAEGALGAMWHGVPVHSVRLPGLVAHQEVLFGSLGELLTIRHDSLDRAGFMPGLLMCVRKVGSLSGLVIGLDKLMF